jgi:hypothetical protein
MHYGLGAIDYPRNSRRSRSNNLLPLSAYKFARVTVKERFIMRTRTLIQSLLIGFSIFASQLACAELYKWVDERGVTNYSNQPPADPKAAKKLAHVEDRVSVYTPDRPLLQAVEAAQVQRNSRAANERVANLERQLESERRARQYAAAAQAAADPCAGNLNCDGYYGGGYYPPGLLAAPLRPRIRNVAQAQLPPGAIAGNVVGTNGFIAGNSAAFGSLGPARASRSSSIHRGFATR